MKIIGKVFAQQTNMHGTVVSGYDVFQSTTSCLYGTLARRSPEAARHDARQIIKRRTAMAKSGADRGAVIAALDFLRSFRRE